MEGALFEVDVHTLEVKKLSRGLPRGIMEKAPTPGKAGW